MAVDKVFRWITSLEGQGCKIIGIQGPQGGGKSTLVKQLEEMMDRDGITCATLSMDDVYWPHADQVQLAANHADNPLLQVSVRACES